MEKRHLPAPHDLAGDVARQHRGIAPPARIGMRAHPADLAHSGQLQSFAGHRQQLPVLPLHPPELRQLVGTRAKRPRLGQRRQRHHRARIGVAQRDDAGWGSSDLEPLADHLYPHPAVESDAAGRQRHRPALKEQQRVLSALKQPRDRAQRPLAIIRAGNKRRYVGQEPPRRPRSHCEPRLPPGQRMPDRAVEGVSHGVSMIALRRGRKPRSAALDGPSAVCLNPVMSSDRILQHLAHAEHALQAGNPEQARLEFGAVLALDDSDPIARNWLGADALAQGDAAAAAIHFDVACRREPEERSHWMNLATAHRALGQCEPERAALEAALAIDQTDLLALVRFAELHERLGEDRRAAERWSAVRALSAGIADPAPEFAAILAHAGRFLGQQQRSLAAALDGAMSAPLAAAGTRDRRRMQVAADAWLGRRPIYANQCEGLHYPFLQADEFYDRDQFPWLADLEAATATIAAELEAILASPEAALTPYVSLPPGVPSNKWSGLDQSLDWGAFHLWREGERFDDACARAPQTAALVEALPIARIDGRAPNIFFSILKAGSHIPAHSGVTNVRSVVHLPLIVPVGCRFRVGGETRAWVRGQAFAFDDTIEHEAWNPTREDRAILIIDAWNPYLSDHEQSMIRDFYKAADGWRE